jgi:hypothetical protein
MARTFKPWAQRSATQVRRLERAGFTERSYAAATPAERRAAFSHGPGQAPEHPRDATRNPDKFREYNEKHGPSAEKKYAAGHKMDEFREYLRLNDRKAYRNWSDRAVSERIDLATESELNEILKTPVDEMQGFGGNTSYQRKVMIRGKMVTIHPGWYK